MPLYRAYMVDGRGHIHRPPHTFESDDDGYVNGCDVELWDHQRLVAWVRQDGVTVKS